MNPPEFRKSIERLLPRPGAYPRDDRGAIRLFEKILTATEVVREAGAKSRTVGLALEGSPFDDILLQASSLYRKSRRLYLACGGRFTKTVVSGDRSLEFDQILRADIHYTPIMEEALWCLSKRSAKAKESLLGHLRRYNMPLFHEQNHSIIWRNLPPPPREPAALRRYLNLSESLTVTLDAALANELGPHLTIYFLAAQAVYRGAGSLSRSARRRPWSSRKLYINHLRRFAYSSYCMLEGYSHSATMEFCSELNTKYPVRCDDVNLLCNLSPMFIHGTNKAWQKRYADRAWATLRRHREAPLILPRTPKDFAAYFSAADPIFSLFNIALPK